MTRWVRWLLEDLFEQPAGLLYMEGEDDDDLLEVDEVDLWWFKSEDQGVVKFAVSPTYLRRSLLALFALRIDQLNLGHSLGSLVCGGERRSLRVFLCNLPVTGGTWIRLHLGSRPAS